MREPKYKLNQTDAKRWHDLLIRHCFEAPNLTVRQKKLKQTKYPSLTKAENIEFERLCRKRSRKHAAHPKVKAAIRRSYRQNRKLRVLAAQVEHLLNNIVDRKQ